MGIMKRRLDELQGRSSTRPAKKKKRATPTTPAAMTHYTLQRDAAMKVPGYIVKPSPRIPLLVSFSHLRDPGVLSNWEISGTLKLSYDGLVDTMLVPGSFGAYMAGEPVKLDEYIRFIHKYKRIWHAYAALEVVRDPGETLENFREMQRQGLNPIPVHTAGNTKADMDRLFQESPLGFVMIDGISVAEPG